MEEKTLRNVGFLLSSSSGASVKFAADLESRLIFVAVAAAAAAIWELCVLIVPARRSLKALAAGVVPGLGHCYAGRPLIGLLYFAAATTSLNAAVLGYALWFGPGASVLFWSGLLVYVITFFTALSGVMRTTVLRNPQERALHRENRFKDALVKFLHRDFAGARAAFRELVSWDYRDFDAWFYQGLSSRYESAALRESAKANERAGRPLLAVRCRYQAARAFKRALSCYRRCILADEHGKWSDEIAGELESIRDSQSPADAEAAPQAAERANAAKAAPVAGPYQDSEINVRKERLLDEIRAVRILQGRRRQH